MTVSSWPDIPAGVAHHHHCVATVEASNEPRHWTDASRATPDLVAHGSGEVLPWLHTLLVDHQAEAQEAYGRHAEITRAVDTYPDAGMWPRLARSLDAGRWVMPTFHLRLGRKLVAQILCFANETGGHGCPVCTDTTHHTTGNETP